MSSERASVKTRQQMRSYVYRFRHRYGGGDCVPLLAVAVVQTVLLLTCHQTLSPRSFGPPCSLLMLLEQTIALSQDITCR